MIRRIGLEQVQKMKEQGAQIVDVLASKEYSEEPIPGAINIPLKQLDDKTAGQLDRTRPVLVYCNDFG